MAHAPAAPRRRWRVDDRIVYIQNNPKKLGSSAYVRYERYKRARSIGEALQLGAAYGDIAYDFTHSFFRTLPKLAGGSAACHRTSRVKRGVRVRSTTPFTHVISLGSRCLMANTLKEVKLRRYASPFDWVYSNAEMVRHCLLDNFREFLCARQICRSGLAFGHRLYSGMLRRGVVFPHHDPGEKHRLYFRRAVSRFRSVLQARGRKLFVMCNVVKSGRDYVVGQEWHDTVQLFESLRGKGITDFELLTVTVACGAASAVAGKKAPEVRRCTRSLCVGRSQLLQHELHCRKDCTGKFLKAEEDAAALRKLVIHGRRFNLKADPLVGTASDKRGQKRGKDRTGSPTGRSLSRPR